MRQRPAGTRGMSEGAVVQVKAAGGIPDPSRRRENPTAELVSRWARTCRAVTTAQSGDPDRLRRDRFLGATAPGMGSAAERTVEDLQLAWNAFLPSSVPLPVASRWPDAFGRRNTRWRSSINRMCSDQGKRHSAARPGTTQHERSRSCNA